MAFIITNVSNSNVVYQGQTIVPAGTYSVPDPGTNFASDYRLINDLIGNNVTISVNSSTYSGQAALDILATISDNITTVSNSFLNGAISVTTTAVLAKVGTSMLNDRKLLIITPTNGTIYYGASSSVTTTNGSPIFKNQTLSLSFTNSIPIYLISTGTVDVRIGEAN